MTRGQTIDRPFEHLRAFTMHFNSVRIQFAVKEDGFVLTNLRCLIGGSFISLNICVRWTMHLNSVRVQFAVKEGGFCVFIPARNDWGLLEMADH